MSFRAITGPAGDTLGFTTLDQLGRSTQSLPAFEQLRGKGASLRVLDLGGETGTPTPR